MRAGRCCVQLVLPCQNIQMMNDGRGKHLKTQLEISVDKLVKLSLQGNIMVLKGENSSYDQQRNGAKRTQDMQQSKPIESMSD